MAETQATPDDREFKELTKAAYRRIIDSFENIDPDEAEADFHLDNISIVFKNGVKFIVNRQPPVRQLWLATKKKGLHFNYEPEKQAWLCDKSGRDFYAVFEESVSEMLGKPFKVVPA